LSLAKVTFIKIAGKSTPFWTTRWCGSMLLHHRIVYNDVLLPAIFINVTLTRLKFKLPDDGSRPKLVGEILIQVLI